MSWRAASFVAFGAVAIATVLAYAVALRGPFLVDDFDSVLRLANAQSAGASWWQLLTEAPSHIRARWLANASFLASHAMAGAPAPPDAFAFKAGNLAIHLACGLAVLALARRVCAIAGFDGRRAVLTASMASAFFLLHPLLVSTVAYVVQRQAQLATLFALLAVNAYVAWRSDFESRTPARHVLGVGAVLAFIALAVSSKESGALAPLLILCAELALFRWPDKESPARSRFDAGFGLACAGPLVVGAVLLGMRFGTLLGEYARRDFTLAERLLTQVHVVADYLAQIAWPRIGEMGLLRDDFPVQHAFSFATGALLLAMIAAVATTFALRRRWPLLALGTGWFFAAHALESTFIPLELVFEHRNYLALFGPALVVASLLSRWPRAGSLLALLVAGILGALTHQRAQDWRDYERWIDAEVAHHPGSLRAGTDRFFALLSKGDNVAAGKARERLAAAMPNHAQPTVLKLAFACHGVIRLDLFTAAELRLLATGRLGKDALHVFGLLMQQAPQRCQSVDWLAFAQASQTLAGNRAGAATPASRAAWWRFSARAWLEMHDWAETRAAVERVLQHEDNDPRDWLLMAEAAAHLGDRAAYSHARQRLMMLVEGRPGPLAGKLAEIDALVAPAG